MKEKLVAARDIRVGAERLRQLAANETDPERAAEMRRIAHEMDDHAAELEHAIANPRAAAQNSARTGSIS